MVVDLSLLQILISMVLPVAVGIVTTKVAHPGVKAVLLAVFAALTSIAGAAIVAGGVVASEVVMQAIFNLVVSVATYYGVWKPTGVAESVQDHTASKGITLVRDPKAVDAA